MKRKVKRRKIDRNYRRKMVNTTEGPNQMSKAWQNWCTVYVTTADEKSEKDQRLQVKITKHS
jgi:hypothetical protein